MANVATVQSFTNGGANNSYYNILPGDTVQISGNDPGQDAVQIAQQICA